MAITIGMTPNTTTHQGGAIDATRVLVVEDDPGNRLLLRRVLEDEGYAVTEAGDGPAALHAITNETIALVVLDLGLPGVDGVEVLQRMRRSSGVPVLVLSGRSQEIEKLRVLDAGADDYVVKPYSLPELSARVRALLRRGTPIARQERFEQGNLAIDVSSREVTIEGAPVEFTPKEFDLLAFLMSSPGRSWSRDELLHYVWGSTDDWQNPATVTEHVRRVRLKIESDPRRPHWIQTVRGMGYRFRAAG
jgi:two-component system, OmpR family, phosphate regulon response regulator PhoB